MVKRMNESNMQGSWQLDRLGELLDMLRDVDGIQDQMNENLDALSSFYFNMYVMGKANPDVIIEFYDRVKPILESLNYALEDFISDSNIVLTDKKYRNYLHQVAIERNK